MKQVQKIRRIMYHRKMYEFYKKIIADEEIDEKNIRIIRKSEEEVIQIIAEKYWVEKTELFSRYRYTPLPQARSEIVKILRNKNLLTFDRIAYILWYSSHASIIYLYNKNYESKIL